MDDLGVPLFFETPMYTGKVYIKTHGSGSTGYMERSVAKNDSFWEYVSLTFCFASNLHSKSKKITRSKVVIKYHKTTTHHLEEHESRIGASRKTTGFRMAKPPGCTCDDFLAWPKTICAFCVVILLSTKQNRRPFFFLPFFHLLKCTLEDFCWISFVVFFLLVVSCSHHGTLEPVEPTKGERWIPLIRNGGFKKSRRRKENGELNVILFLGEGEVLAETSIFVWQRWFWFNLSSPQGGGNSNIFFSFHHLTLGKCFIHFDWYVSNGLVQPPTS